MQRIIGPLILAVVGALISAAAIVGLDAAARTGAPEEPGDEGRSLDVDGYCQHAYGDRAAGYQPAEPGGWMCSTWQNDVWGLEPLDLREACRWQERDDSVPTIEDRGDERPGRNVVCTL